MKRDDAISWLMRTTAPEEEVYCLVGRDILASDMVLLHAYRMNELNVRLGKVEEAMNCAQRMALQPMRKIPD